MPAGQGCPFLHALCCRAFAWQGSLALALALARFPSPSLPHQGSLAPVASISSLPPAQSPSTLLTGTFGAHRRRIRAGVGS